MENENILENKINKAVELIEKYGQIDGSYHKTWVIDQVLRILLGDKYEKFIHDYMYLDDNGIEQEEIEYDWDCGIAP